MSGQGITVPTGARTRAVSTAWDDARSVSFGAVGRMLPQQTVPLREGYGRVLAQAVTALVDVPHYASSAMDGWAVADVAAGEWTVLASPATGGESPRLANGQALPIVTGALVRAGTSAVLRSEQGELSAGLLRSTSADAPHPGQHVRRVATEAAVGDTVIDAGTVLNPAHLALAAGCGRDRLSVVSRPRVALVLTGDEVVDSGIPNPGQVRDSFGPQLPHVVELLGGTVSSLARVPDNAAALRSALLQDARASELVITTGGTGRSTADHLRATLAGLGATVLIDSVAMRPGGPTMLWRLPDERFVIALPGNPLAAMVGLMTVAVPLVAAMLGSALPATGDVRVAAEAPGRAGTTLLVPFRLADGGAVTSDWTGSGMMRGLADADGVLVVPPEGVRAGGTSRVIDLPWGGRRA